MSTGASGSVAGYVSVVRYPITFWINILLVSIIYMLFMLRSHKHIHDVTNLLIIVAPNNLRLPRTAPPPLGLTLPPHASDLSGHGSWRWRMHNAATTVRCATASMVGNYFDLLSPLHLHSSTSRSDPLSLPHMQGLTRHGHGGGTMRTQGTLPREHGHLWASTATVAQCIVAEF